MSEDKKDAASREAAERVSLHALPPSRNKCRGGGMELVFLKLVLGAALILLVVGAMIYFTREGVNVPHALLVDGDLEVIGTQLLFFREVNGVLPSTEQGLQALVIRPAGEPQPAHWSRQMPEVPLDPWGTPYQYRRPGTHANKDGYDLFSHGKDRLAGTADDMGNW